MKLTYSNRAALPSTFNINRLCTKKQTTKNLRLRNLKKCFVRAISRGEFKDHRTNSEDLDEVAHGEPVTA